MNNFIDKLIARHIQPEGNVKPRIKSRFESNPNVHFNLQESIEEVPQNPDDIAKKNEIIYNDLHYSEHKENGQLNTNIDSNINRKAVIEANENLNQNQSKTPDKLVQSNVVKPLVQIKEERSSLYNEREDLISQSLISQPVEGEKEQSDKKGKEDVTKPFLATTKIAQSPDFSQPIMKPNFKLDQTNDELSTNSKAPIIKVTIGNIDVRANIQQSTPSVRKKRVTKPQLTLEDYLKKRK